MTIKYSRGLELSLTEGGGDAIPGSVIAQYDASTYSTGDSVWVDDVGSDDISIVGDPQADQLADGDDSILFDGVDDGGTAPYPSGFNGNLQNEWSVEFKFETATSGAEQLFGRTTTPNLRLGLNWDSGFNTDDGNFNFRVDPEAGVPFYFSPDTNPGVTDGNPHIVSIIVNDFDNRNIDVVVDGTTYGITIGRDDGGTRSTSYNGTLGYGAFYDGTSLGNYLDGEEAKIRWHDQAITSQTLS